MGGGFKNEKGIFLFSSSLHTVCPLLVSSADLGEGIDPQPPLEELPADEKTDESNNQADALSNNVSSEETQSETETEADSDSSCQKLLSLKSKKQKKLCTVLNKISQKVQAATHFHRIKKSALPSLLCLS